MTKAHKTIVITFGSILGLLIIVAGVLLATPGIIYVDGKFYTQVVDYSPRIPDKHGIVSECMAFMPSCGYCVDNLHPGKDTLVRNEQCFRAL